MPAVVCHLIHIVLDIVLLEYFYFLKCWPEPWSEGEEIPQHAQAEFRNIKKKKCLGQSDSEILSDLQLYTTTNLQSLQLAGRSQLFSEKKPREEERGE